MAKKTSKKSGIAYLCVTPNYFAENSTKYEAGVTYNEVPDEIKEYFKEVEVEATEEVIDEVTE